MTTEDKRQRLNLSSTANTFENYEVSQDNTESLNAFKAIANGASWYMLLNYGGAGCGKTHLCEALAQELDKKGVFARVIEWPEQVRVFKRSMHSNKPGLYDQIFENFRKAPFLIIDDVGMGTVGSEWEWGELEDIVNYRYRNHLPTVLTTNLDVKTDIPERIYSRFRDAVTSRCVLNNAGDYRPRKKAVQNE